MQILKVDNINFPVLIAEEKKALLLIMVVRQAKYRTFQTTYAETWIQFGIIVGEKVQIRRRQAYIKWNI